jgi:hypothetical protein
VHVQPVGLNAETKKDRHRADGERCLLTFPFIGLVRLALNQACRLLPSGLSSDHNRELTLPKLANPLGFALSHHIYLC